MSLSDDAECSNLVERRNRHYDISRINEIAVAVAGKIIGTRSYFPMKRFPEALYISFPRYRIFVIVREYLLNDTKFDIFEPN